MARCLSKRRKMNQNVFFFTSIESKWIKRGSSSPESSRRGSAMWLDLLFFRLCSFCVFFSSSFFFPGDTYRMVFFFLIQFWFGFFVCLVFFFAVINRRWWPCVAPQMAALSPASVSLSGRKWIRSHWIRRVWWRTSSALTPQIEIDQRRMECHALFAGTQFVTRSTINSVNH